MKRAGGLFLLLIILSCVRKHPLQPHPPQEREIQAEEGEKIERIIKEKGGEVPEVYTVVKGDCLWKISGKEEIYNDPFMWPIIYHTNRDKIKNPDLIYPGQKFIIPRSGISLDEIRNARRMAGAKKPYDPPENARLPR